MQQIAYEAIPPMSMEELWKKMGDEYTAEFYGYPYKRVPDFTDEPAEGWEGKRLSSEHCPMCKSANVHAVKDDVIGRKTGSSLVECKDCHGFYSLLSQ